MIRLAMVGTSGYAGYLMDRLWELPDLCQIVAAATLDKPDNPRVINCVKRGVRVFPSLEALLTAVSPKGCAAIVVATGIDSHFTCAAQAMAAGFHVLLEKPPVPTVQDVDALIKLQQHTGRVSAVHFQFLYTDVNQRLKRLLASGSLGAIRRLRAVAAWPRPVQYFQRSPWTGRLCTADGWVLDGTVGNPLAHLLAHELFFATAKPGLAALDTVQAELYHVNDIESEDTSALRIVTDEGVEILYCASLATATQRDVLLEIETENAIVRQVDFADTVVCHHDGRKEVLGEPHPSKTEGDKIVRRHMLTTILNAVARGEPQPFDLATCRPYVLGLNAAFESNGPPKPIPAEFKHTFVTENLQQVVVENIEHDLDVAFSKRLLFSEAGVPWATAGSRFTCDHYAHFPADPSLKALEPRPASAAAALDTSRAKAHKLRLS
ncbi:MAG TPA: Gfo/Idh/MocA family oxidoreductase [Verrucomicrobiae bacterium]|nr:Gfo/Idh/MocA family oxidoreductase [Verrucomicrobiae bacterium]